MLDASGRLGADPAGPAGPAGSSGSAGGTGPVSGSIRGSSALTSTLLVAAFVTDDQAGERITIENLDADVTGVELALDADDPLASRGGFDVDGHVHRIEAIAAGQTTECARHRHRDTHGDARRQ